MKEIETGIATIAITLMDIEVAIKGLLITSVEKELYLNGVHSKEQYMKNLSDCLDKYHELSGTLIDYLDELKSKYNSAE